MCPAHAGMNRFYHSEGERVAGIYRQRVTLTSGRQATIDNGLGVQLVPWRPTPEQQLGRQVSRVASHSGAMEWNFGRKMATVL